MSTLTFIEKAKRVHGDVYDYTNTKYVRLHTPVDIICRKHGLFSQTPNTHIHSKSGCPECGGVKRHTTKSFIEKSALLHNHKYDYTNVSYTNNKTKVVIVCPNHGTFLQTPSDHLMGYGCNKCAEDKGRMSLDDFISKARTIHGDLYDYTKTLYVNTSTKLTITCPKHGDFLVSPNSHLSHSSGCKKCKNSRGENQIYVWLKNHNFTDFVAEKSFDGCVSPKNIKLRYDFYIPSHNLLIEFDGAPHFSPAAFGRNMTSIQQQDNYNRAVLHDLIKTKYADDNNISLLRIRYDENVYDKLNNYFIQVPQSFE